MSATSQEPAGMAAIAGAMWITKEEPPTDVEAVKWVGMPMDSATA